MREGVAPDLNDLYIYKHTERQLCIIQKLDSVCIMSKMSNKQQLLMHSLQNFFETNAESFVQFQDIIQPNSKVSLRVIDWFITNYSRAHDINFPHPRNEEQLFVVHDSYKSQLKAYSKRQFDPFCRRMRINFYSKPTEKVVTTVGQLNFFRWAIENGVMQYIHDNFAVIEEHMKDYVRDNRETKKQMQIVQKKHGGGQTLKAVRYSPSTDNKTHHQSMLHKKLKETGTNHTTNMSYSSNVINHAKITKQSTPITVCFH